ncbi:MAG: hypothetical protein WD579_00490 [Candidatus Paceibacterota bacterium]
MNTHTSQGKYECGDDDHQRTVRHFLSQFPGADNGDFFRFIAPTLGIERLNASYRYSFRFLDCAPEGIDFFPIVQLFLKFKKLSYYRSPAFVGEAVSRVHVYRVAREMLKQLSAFPRGEKEDLVMRRAFRGLMGDKSHEVFVSDVEHFGNEKFPKINVHSKLSFLLVMNESGSERVKSAAKLLLSLIYDRLQGSGEVSLAVPKSDLQKLISSEIKKTGRDPEDFSRLLDQTLFSLKKEGLVHIYGDMVLFKKTRLFKWLSRLKTPEHQTTLNDPPLITAENSDRSDNEMETSDGMTQKEKLIAAFADIFNEESDRAIVSVTGEEKVKISFPRSWLDDELCGRTGFKQVTFASARRGIPEMGFDDSRSHEDPHLWMEMPLQKFREIGINRYALAKRLAEKGRPELVKSHEAEPEDSEVVSEDKSQEVSGSKDEEVQVSSSQEENTTEPEVEAEWSEEPLEEPEDDNFEFKESLSLPEIDEKVIQALRRLPGRIAELKGRKRELEDELGEIDEELDKFYELQETLRDVLEL